MRLALLLAVPLLGGFAALWAGRRSPNGPRRVALAAMALNAALVLSYWPVGGWHDSLRAEWVARLGIGFALTLDGLSAALVLLTCALGSLAIIASWTEVRERVGFFHANLLWILAGVTGVFLARDLFLLYFLWELMLVPMYFVIDIWGHEERRRAAVKFFIFTQATGLLMLVAILGLYWLHGQQTGTYTFAYDALLQTPAAGAGGMLLFLGFYIAFTTKLGVLPFHTWLPDAHTQAPTGGSVILAGLLLKTGAYGLIRFAVPLFPATAYSFAPVGMALGVAAVIYGAVLALGQSDLKRLVAYTSVSHMGWVLLGVFTGNRIALLGAVVQIVSHGLATGGLFFAVGALQERLRTRDLQKMGGLWATAPRMGAVTLFLALAAMGLPGMASFVAELLVLLGAWQVSPVLAALAALGMVLSTAYALRMVQAVFHGREPEGLKMPDFGLREMAAAWALVVGLLFFGLYPKPLLRLTTPALLPLREIEAQQAEPPQAAEPSLVAADPAKGEDQ